MRRLSSDKRRSFNAVVLVLMALQLMLGLQLQAARAVAAPMPSAMYVMAHHPPVMSMSMDLDMGAAGATADHQASQPDCPKHSSTPHDCCHASACQCQCVYTPGAIALPALANIATPVAVLSVAATQFVAPPINEFLRPPIA